MVFLLFSRELYKGNSPFYLWARENPRNSGATSTLVNTLMLRRPLFQNKARRQRREDYTHWPPNRPGCVTLARHIVREECLAGPPLPRLLIAGADLQHPRQHDDNLSSRRVVPPLDHSLG